MNSSNIRLRRLTLADIDTPLLERPVMFTGSISQANSYAKEQGFAWKKSNNVFGGYFADSKGDCLIPT